MEGGTAIEEIATASVIHIPQTYAMVQRLLQSLTHRIRHADAAVTQQKGRKHQASGVASKYKQ